MTELKPESSGELPPKELAEDRSNETESTNTTKEVEPSVNTDENKIPASKRPRPHRPSTHERNAIVDDLRSKIDALKESIKKKRAILTAKSTASSGELAILKEEHAKNKALQKVRNRLQKEFKAAIKERDVIETQIKKMVEECKSMRDSIKYTNLDEVNRRIEDLEHKQGTVSMSLNEEKALLKQIKELNVSKRVVQQFADKNTQIKALKEQKDALRPGINQKHKLVKEANEKTDAQWEKIQKLNETYKKKGDEFPKLKKEIQACYDEIKTHQAGIDKAYQDFKKANQAWFEWNKAVQAEREEELKEQKRLAQEKYEEELAAFEAEEAKKKAMVGRNCTL